MTVGLAASRSDAGRDGGDGDPEEFQAEEDAMWVA